MLNNVAIMGRLVANPEIRHTKSGIAVASIRLAVDRNYGEDKQTDFFDVIAWRSTAEFVSKYFEKGQMIAIDGRLQSRTWTTDSGDKRKVVEIVADSVYFCGSKKEKAVSTTTAPGFEDIDDDDLPWGNDDSLPL